ncbi:hypothetical protein [Alistipes communis]|uniref:hypothetical protein n=1 Tax=Alistipes communis TaxID=2585118 RepID=UPI0039F580CE
MKSAGYILPLVCAALFLTAYRSTAQPSLYANPFIEQIEHYPQEKLHVSTDKDSYIAGDTIWLRAHCADAATHRPVAASRYVYVELRDDRGSLVRRIKLLSRDSVYSGYLPTQSLERFGDYSLTAYTLYMRNQGPDYFFKKPLTIWPYQESRRTQRNTSVRKVSDFDVSFFPEGGYLIDGYDCCVAFKALGDDGGSVEVAGVVKNDREEVVDTLRTLHGGMGCLRFTAHTGERYYAECTMAGGKTERFDLPASNNLACVLRVLQTERDFTVMVQSGRPLPKGLRLLVHCRGNLCYFREWNDDLPSLIFKRDKLPGGVLQILLLDKAGNALSERLVFNRGEELATTDVQIGGTLEQRTKVTLSVAATDPDGGPAAGDFSIAVTDRAAVPSATSGSIYSTLLLTSELRGTIETPDWYFEGRDAARVAALDALLLTQGWRRYDVPAAVRGEYATPAYPLEVGQEIAGRINKGGLWNRRKKLDRYEMRMIVPRWHYSSQAPIDKEGRFALNGFDFPDSTLYVLRPAAAKGLLPEATVKVARDSFPEVGTLPRVPAQEQKKPYIAQARYYIEQRGQTDMRNILIDTVYVTHHKRLESTRPEHRLAARTWTAEQIKESGAGTILDFIARMPGMSVVGRQVSYRGYRPGFMVDGRLEETVGEMNPVRAFRSTGMGRNHKTQTRLPPIPDPGGWIDFTGMNYSNTNSAQQSTGGNKRQIQYIDDFDNVPDILYYPLEIVSRIDLIEGGNMVLWGVSHWKQAGIISITTKKGKELDDATRTLPARDVEFVSPLGYQTPAEFYAPAYATEKARRSMVPDYRTTLYWNPTVKLDDTGQATVEFYTSDAPADYDITIEGITQTGKIVRTVKIITE